MVLVELATLAAGLALIYYASEKSVEYSTHIATHLKVPPLIIGVVLVSVGTDIPEIANSIFSSYTGHGDINVGNALGSCLTQISLVLGLVTLMGGAVHGTRRNILVLGGGATLAVAIAAFVVLDGQLDQADAALLIVTYLAILAATTKLACRESGTKDVDLSHLKNGLAKTLGLMVASLIGVVVGAVVVVENVIALSALVGVPEYFVSFFALSLGTSLPELSVELAALRKRNYGILVGDLMGSNITDATLALGIGPLLFPTVISQGIIAPVVLYVIFVSIVAVALFAWREKIDKKAAALLVGLYLISYLFLV